MRHMACRRGLIALSISENLFKNTNATIGVNAPRTAEPGGAGEAGEPGPEGVWNVVAPAVSTNMIRHTSTTTCYTL
jgi:hypothetical protein